MTSPLCSAYRGEALPHLHRELACWRENQRARPAGAAEESLHDREGEGGGLAGAGLGETHDVASAQNERNGASLDRRGRGVAGVRYGAKQLWREHQLGEARGRVRRLVFR